MRLLLDANLSPRLVVPLLEAGYDAVHVGDLELLGAPETRSSSTGQLRVATSWSPPIPTSRCSWLINPVIYAEVSVRFSRIEDLDDALPGADYERLALPWEAAFLAGKAFLNYRRNRGTRTSTLPDFFIGAHAAVARLQLLTRDPSRYRSYFPTVALATPR